MAQEINVSNSPYSEQRVTLGGSLLTLVFKYNSRNQSWYVDILNSDSSVLILGGIKIVPNQNLTGRYLLPEFPSGNLWCLRKQNDLSLVSRDNLGFDKTYGLFWIDDTEERELQINGTIQL